MAKARLPMALTGMALAVAALASPLYCGEACSSVEELYALSVVSGIILASYLIGEALEVVPAILEILLGFLAATAGIEPTSTLETLALVGSVFLMFAAGTEIDVRLLRRYFLRSVLVGVVSFAAPFAAASLAVRLLGYTLRQALLTGIGVSTTSVVVVYAIIKSLGILRRERGQVVLASAMAADVASIIVFVVLMVEFTPLLIAYVASLAIVPPVAGALFKRLPRAAHEPEIRLIMAILLGVALFSEVVGVHAILFAFILGVALGEAMHLRRPLPEKVSGLVFGFLSPIFFVTAGLHIGPAGMQGGLLLLSLAVLAASFPVKIVATHIALSRLAYVRNPRLSVVFGARLTVSTIIAYAGLLKGLLPPELAATIMLTALVTTVTAGIAAGWRAVEESLELEEKVVIPAE